MDREMHLLVTVPAGRNACLPSAWTVMFEPAGRDSPLRLNAASIRALRLVLDLLAARKKPARPRSRRPKAE
jgi:hypothetical protein